MKIGDIVYIIAIVFFAWITFGIIRGNFQRKFDEQGRRKDLVDDSEESSTRSFLRPCSSNLRWKFPRTIPKVIQAKNMMAMI